MQSNTRNRRITAVAGVGLALTLAVTGCSAGAGSSAKSGQVTLTVATASVPQFDDVRSLTSSFEKANPNIKIKYVTLPEDQLRDKLTQGVATGSSPYDVVAVGPYEVPIWSHNGWLADVTKYANDDKGYDVNDIVSEVRAGLGSNGKLFAVPFSGESSMLMYRKDLFEAKGLTMPANPTWDQVAALAAKVQDKSANVAGICMRGAGSWGSSMAALNPIINTFGGIWYDKNWKPQFQSAPVEKAVNFYVKLQQQYGIPGAASAGFPECLTAFGQGQAAMWFDATSAGSSVEDSKLSSVAGKVGYVNAPVESWNANGWLWSWNLAMTQTSKNKDAAWKYMAWATSKDYVKLVGDKLGWSRAPAATRESTYKIADYLKAAPFAAVSLESVKKADPTKHALPTPYTGILFLGLPSYQDFGTQVSQQISAAIAGTTSVQDALKASDDILAKAAPENKKWIESEKK